MLALQKKMRGALLIVFSLALYVQSAAANEPIIAGAQTKGGIYPGAKIFEVTTLADEGPGSLREAVEQVGPRVVLFKVAGRIELLSSLRVSHPFITIAGQSAPWPGILISGSRLRITTHDVVIQHISIRPHWTGEIPNNADAISIGTCGDCGLPPKNILLENISLSWAIDENIGTWGEGISNVSLRASLIAEALRNAGHPKGAHSMGFLVGKGNKAVEITGNIFTSNNRRNPVLSTGTSSYVANNFIYNPGQFAVHMFSGEKLATLVRNIVVRGPDSRRDLKWLVLHGPQENAQIYAASNYCCERELAGQEAAPIFDAISPPVEANWELIPAGGVVDWTLKFAGSRPAERHPIDQRIIRDIRLGQGRIIDDPSEVGGYLQPHGEYAESSISLPSQPFERAGRLEKLRLEAWLCLRHLKVGGPQSSECSESVEELERALDVGG